MVRRADWEQIKRSRNLMLAWFIQHGDVMESADRTHDTARPSVIEDSLRDVRHGFRLLQRSPVLQRTPMLQARRLLQRRPLLRLRRLL